MSKPKTTAAAGEPKSLGEKIIDSLNSPIARMTRVVTLPPDDDGLDRGRVQSEEWDKQGRLINRTYYE